jgi:hypothetical protein
MCSNSLSGFTLDILLLFVSFDSAKSTLGVVLDLMCSSSSFSEIGSSFVTSGVAFLEISAHVFILELCSGSPASLVSQSLRMAAALLIFCRSWAASVSVYSMRSPPAHIWTCCMQLGVREKKNVCNSTSPKKPSLGPCSINSLNLFQAWSIPSSSPCVNVDG